MVGKMNTNTKPQLCGMYEWQVTAVLTFTV